jgi:hypothetical protein
MCQYRSPCVGLYSSIYLYVPFYRALFHKHPFLCYLAQSTIGRNYLECFSAELLFDSIDLIFTRNLFHHHNDHHRQRTSRQQNTHNRHTTSVTHMSSPSRSASCADLSRVDNAVGQPRVTCKEVADVVDVGHVSPAAAHNKGHSRRHRRGRKKNRREALGADEDAEGAGHPTTALAAGVDHPTTAVATFHRGGAKKHESLTYDPRHMRVNWQRGHLRIYPLSGVGEETHLYFSAPPRATPPGVSLMFWSTHAPSPRSLGWTAAGALRFGFDADSLDGTPQWKPMYCEDPKDFECRSGSLLISAILPLAKDMERRLPNAEGFNVHVRAPSLCQRDIRYLLSTIEHLKLDPPKKSHFTVMAYLDEKKVEPPGKAMYWAMAEADILLRLPTPVAEEDIISSIADYAGKYGYCTFPPSRFPERPKHAAAATTEGAVTRCAADAGPVAHATDAAAAIQTAASTLSVIDSHPSSTVTVAEVAFGQSPRSLSIHHIVGEVAVPASFWLCKLCQVVRDMDCVGFNDTERILPVLVLNGTAEDWGRAKKAMADFFSHLPSGVEYLDYLRKYLIVLHDEAALHPTNVLEELKKTVATFKTELGEVAKTLHEHHRTITDRFRAKDDMLRAKDDDNSALTKTVTTLQTALDEERRKLREIEDKLLESEDKRLEQAERLREHTQQEAMRVMLAAKTRKRRGMGKGGMQQ